MPVQLPASRSILLKVEDSATSRGPEQMTDTGNAKKFSSTGVRFSMCASDENGIDRRPQVNPDGVKNGCLVVPATSGAGDSLDVKTGSIWISSTLVTVSAVTDMALTRPSVSMSKKISITVDSLGAVAALDGTEASSLSDTRGAAGGPPYVTAGLLELAVVSLTSDVSAAVDDDEVKFAPEWSHTPSYRLLPYSAKVEFAASLSAIHTGGTAKAVWISWYEPQLSQLDVISFTPPLGAFTTDAPSGKRTPTPKGGSMSLTLGGTQADLARKIDGKVRLFEFMPDSTGTRKEVSYLGVEIGAAYSAGDAVMTGKALLTPMQTPLIETV